MMRKPYWLMIGAMFILPIPAQAQKITAKGAAAAGVCSGALDLAAGMKAKSGNTPPAELVNMQHARDFFAELPMYEKTEITANAEAFVRLMTERMAAAKTDAQRASVTSEIGKIAKGCFDSASKYAVRAGQPATTPQPVPTQPLPTQPLQTQPLQTQPLTVQPESQPLILDPQPQPQ